MDDENVPRRLRRFLRKGEPIPENLLPKELPHDEPWNQPAVTARAKSNIAVSSRQAAEEAMAPRHRGKRFQEMQEKGFSASPPSPMDKAIGLEKKSQFQERLPASGNKAIEMKKDEIQKALEEIKKFSRTGNASNPSPDTLDQMADHITEQNRNEERKQEEKNSSFHFTAVGTAPNPVDARKLGSNPPQSNDATPAPLPSSIPISDLSKLSARERMELRRQRRGQSIAPAGNGVGSASGQDIIPSPNVQNQPPRSHVRRRMGQVDESAAREEGDEAPPEENMSPEAEADFKDLFADEKAPPKKKKAGKPVSEDEELDTEEDMELFEEEK